MVSPARFRTARPLTSAAHVRCRTRAPTGHDDTDRRGRITDRPAGPVVALRGPQDLARVLRRPVHRPGRGADLLRRARRVPGDDRADLPARPGRARATTASTTLLGIVDDLGGAAMVDSVREPLLEISRVPAGRARASSSASVGALWSASGYVGAFGRAMNRIYEIQEGRPIWKLRPVMLLLTAGARRPRGRRPAGAGGHRAGRRRGRRGARRRRHALAGVEHRQVAGDLPASSC